MLILNNFGNQKMDFLTLDKIFVLDNLNIVLDKKYFVQADGRGISEYLDTLLDKQGGHCSLGRDFLSSFRLNIITPVEITFPGF